MLERLRRSFRRTQIEFLSIRFELGRTDDEKHEVRVFKSALGFEEPVVDVHALRRYGYQEEHETERGSILFVVEDADRQTLHALLSLNPGRGESGTLQFDYVPHMLGYLRRKDSIEETEASQRLQLADKPLQPAAHISYDPEEGLEVQIGYAVDGSEELVQQDQLTTTADGAHILVDDTFIPLPKKLSQKAADWLEQQLLRIPLQQIPEFFLRDLVLFKKEFTAVLTDLAAKIEVVQDSMQSVVKVERNEAGWLDFYVGYESGGVILPHGLLAATSDQEFLQTSETTWAKIDAGALADVEQQLVDLGAVPTEDGYRVPITEFASLEEFIQQIGGRAELSSAYHEFIDQLTGFQADESFALAQETERHLVAHGINLRPYQRAGIHWLSWLYENHLHGILADDMGLGKTAQSICMLRHVYEQSESCQHSLIVAPKSVLPHWEREIHRCIPGAKTYRYHGPQRQRLFYMKGPIMFLSTYDTVRRDIDILSKVPFFYVILDEATFIKNPTAGRAQAAKALNAGHRLALTGTPVENRATELWSIFDFLMRGHLGKYGTFERVYEQRITAGDRRATEQLGRRIHPFLLRRMKEDVAKDLPDKIEMTEWCELTEEQRRLYGGLQGKVKELRASLRRGEQVSYATSILPVLTKLKQICDHPALVTGQATPIFGRSHKFDWIANTIAGILRDGEQVVVFSHFLGMLNLFERWLIEDGVSYMRIDGSTNNRQELIDGFNAGRSKVALCSLRAAGHGINLTSANHVIHADRWWNPAVEDQATDRVHRIGQDKTVYVHRILVEGTLEERIDALLTSKRHLADQIIGAATRHSRSWTRKELLELLKPLD